MGLFTRTPAVALAASTLVFFFLVQGTYAQSCRTLQAQLSAVPSGGQSNRSAIASLKRKLVQARRSANQKRCGALFGQRSQECKALNASIKRMSGQLASLQSGQSAGRNSAQRRQQIQAKMRAKGCGRRAVKRQAPAQQQPAQQQPAQQQRAAKPKQTQPQASKRRGKTYRTMCVRLCDGYYFPISFSVPKKYFERDEETCRNRCPGADVALYAHRPGEESEKMISYPEDTPYRDLNTAFSYRKAGFQPNCGCSPSSERSVTAENGDAKDPEPSLETTAALSPPTAGEEKISNIPIPSPAPRGGDLTALRAKPKSLPPPKERHVRIVGPKFLPDPSEVIDLRDPDRLPVQ